MRQTIFATALLALLGAHLTPPGNFTPIPVANGTRECGYDQQCVKNCRGDASCERQCRFPCR
jgi:hypothetical protein